MQNRSDAAKERKKKIPEDERTEAENEERNEGEEKERRACRLSEIFGSF